MGLRSDTKLCLGTSQPVALEDPRFGVGGVVGECVGATAVQSALSWSVRQSVV